MSIKKSLFVTGGAGFIGSNFVNYILENTTDTNLIVFDKLSYSGNLSNLEQWKNDRRFTFVRGDICNANELAKALTKEITGVVHFAAESHVDRSILEPRDFIDTNIIGTYNILERLRLLGWRKATGHKMIHVSTDEVYGTLHAEGYFTEETPYRPNSPYSASKAGSDHLVRAYYHTYGLPLITTNCSNNYGPYQFPEKLIPLMIINSLHGKKLPIYGEGKNIRDWLYVDDHCSALSLVLEKGKLGDTYTIGGRSEKTNLEIVHTVCNLMDEIHPADKPYDTLISFVKDRPGHDFRYAIDCSKIENELGWTRKYNFNQGLEKTVRWYLENEAWWNTIISGEYKNYYEKQYGKQ